MDGRRRGRPALGAELLESIEGASPIARERLEAIVRTLSGEWTLEEACEHLGVGRSWFCEMRSRFLRESAPLLEPRRPGPPPRVETEAERNTKELRQRLDELQIEVEAAQVREEIARVMPRSKSPSGKRGKKRRRRGR